VEDSVLIEPQSPRAYRQYHGVTCVTAVGGVQARENLYLHEVRKARIVIAPIISVWNQEEKNLPFLPL
jgi:hypothetical protein